MKRIGKQPLPSGWDEKKLRAVVDHYDNQTDEEGAAEIDAAVEVTGETLLTVPTALVPVIARLIAEHEQSAENGRPRTRRAASPPSPRKRRKTPA